MKSPKTERRSRCHALLKSRRQCALTLLHAGKHTITPKPDTTVISATTILKEKK